MCKDDIGLPRRNKKEHIFNECSREESVRLNTDLHLSCCNLDHLEKDLTLKHDVRGSACWKERKSFCPCWTSTETHPASFSSFQKRERGLATTNTNTNTETNFKLMTTHPSNKKDAESTFTPAVRMLCSAHNCFSSFRVFSCRLSASIFTAHLPSSSTRILPLEEDFELPPGSREFNGNNRISHLQVYSWFKLVNKPLSLSLSLARVESVDPLLIPCLPPPAI